MVAFRSNYGRNPWRLEIKRSEYSFAARILKAGINPYVKVPQKISRSFGIRVYIPVKGKLNGIPVNATLVPSRGGRHILYLNTEMRRRSKTAPGNIVGIKIKYDDKPRVQPLLPEFAAALRKNPKARGVYENLTPSGQKEILVYLNWLKNPETVKRNVRKIIFKLARFR